MCGKYHSYAYFTDEEPKIHTSFGLGSKCMPSGCQGLALP